MIHHIMLAGIVARSIDDSLDFIAIRTLMTTHLTHVDYTLEEIWTSRTTKALLPYLTSSWHFMIPTSNGNITRGFTQVSITGIRRCSFDSHSCRFRLVSRP